MKLSLTFVLNRSFLDPSTIKIKNEKGEEEEVLYAPRRYKELVRDCYILSRNLHTSYLDTKELTPLERNYLLQLINQERDETTKAFEKEIQENQERLEAIKSNSRRRR